MTHEEHSDLVAILEKDHWQTRVNLLEFIKTVTVGEAKEIEKEKRTSKQNRALHKYLTDLASALQAAGIEQKVFIERLQGWEIPITMEFLKQIWKIKQGKMFLTDSTTKLTTEQVSEVYDAINKFTSQEFGVSEAFPSIETLLIKSEVEKGYDYPEYKGPPLI